MKHFFLILVSVIVFCGCQQNNQSQKQIQSTPSPTASVNPKASGEDKMNPKPKYFNGKGKVTKINLELGSVELDHEEIVGLMPKMIMEFSVKEKSELEKLKVGDKVDFVLEDKGGAEIITEIKKSEQ